MQQHPTNNVFEQKPVYSHQVDLEQSLDFENCNDMTIEVASEMLEL